MAFGDIKPMKNLILILVSLQSMAAFASSATQVMVCRGTQAVSASVYQENGELKIMSFDTAEPTAVFTSYTYSKLLTLTCQAQ